MNDGPIIYDRNVLYEEVWAEPVRTVAARYGVSDVALAKTCRRLDVPLPGRGYWAKRQAGKAPPRPPLPPLAAGVAERYVGARWEAPEQAEPLAGLEEAKPLELPTPILVPQRLEAPHKLVVISARYLEKAKVSGGVLSVARRSCLDIEVSPASLERALRIMDSLLKSLEALGLKIEVAPVDQPPERQPAYGYDRRPREAEPPERVTRVHCDEEWIHFRLEERIRRIRDQGPLAPDGSRSRWETSYDYEPTGELFLELTNVTAPGVKTKWKESKKQPLEQLLEEFVAYLPTVALAFKLEREEEARRAAEAREAEIRRYEEQKRRWEEDDRRREEEKREQALEAEATRWRRAQDIRDYVQAALVVLGDLTPAERQAERDRLRWALEYADRIDPLKQAAKGTNAPLMPDDNEPA